ncbi:MAG TPA: disulfide bond formation protein B [Candidatus Omnitrophota bacterium]|nr:disulfide bond formation protein B [Candidatus Omnitrophota bacterium]
MIAVLSSRQIALFVLAASAIALASAFTAEYGFGLRPCVLCLTQRVPFVIAGALAAAVLLPRGGRWGRGLLALAGLAFLVNSGIAVYHVGVEQKWWASSCAPAAAAPLDDLSAAMSKPVEVRCDEPAWQWNGISMAALNIVFSGGLALVTLSLVRRMEPK